MSDHTILDNMLAVNAALAGLSARNRLDVLQGTWLLFASTARTEALITPGGFPEERARQVEQLRRMAELIAADEPDLEMENMFHEGDVEGMLRHLQALRAATTENGGAA